MNELAIRERVKSRAAAQKEMAPFVDALESLLEQKGAAALRKIRQETFSLDLQPDLSAAEMHYQHYQGQQTLLMLPLSQHINVYGPPYDYGWNWGNPTSQTSDNQTGRFSVIAQSPVTGAAAAGIGLVLTSDKPAFVFVRPYIPYTWKWGAKTIGLGSSAKVRGGIDASAWVDGALCTPVRRDEGFSGSASGFDGMVEGSGGDVAWLENISLNFMMTPGKIYGVSLGAWVECDHSTGIGGAGSAGGVQAKVPFVVVERFVAG